MVYKQIYHDWPLLIRLPSYLFNLFIYINYEEQPRCRPKTMLQFAILILIVVLRILFVSSAPYETPLFFEWDHGIARLVYFSLYFACFGWFQVRNEGGPGW